MSYVTLLVIQFKFYVSFRQQKQYFSISEIFASMDSDYECRLHIRISFRVSLAILANDSQPVRLIQIPRNCKTLKIFYLSNLYLAQVCSGTTLFYYTFYYLNISLRLYFALISLVFKMMKYYNFSITNR